ncbi:hypothetical protein MRB53_026301 [Persea americana]|uniref:Uncharacterized protein n=1 Tax=Persea americana TaxID=3435 RepID=A0ACC2LHY7_PERAE|nr:hypothetical protein MRB53_026301 [Persea americana]
MGQSSVKLSPGLRKKAFDFGVSRNSTRAGSGRHYSLTKAEKAWLFNIRVGTKVYRRHLFVDIQRMFPCVLPCSWASPKAMLERLRTRVLGSQMAFVEKKFWLFFLEKSTEQAFSRTRMSSDRELHKRYLVRSWNSSQRRRLRSLLGYKPSEQRLPWSLPARADHLVRTLSKGQIPMAGRVLPATCPLGAKGEEDSAEVRNSMKILLIWKVLPPLLRRH